VAKTGKRNYKGETAFPVYPAKFTATFCICDSVHSVLWHDAYQAFFLSTTARAGIRIDLAA